MKKAYTVAQALTQSETAQRLSRFRIAAIWLVTVLATLLALSISTAVFSQDYDSLPVDPSFTSGDASANRSAIGQGKNAVKNAVSNSSSNFGAQGELYLKGYWVPKMTQQDASTMNRFGALRAAFLKEFLYRKLPAQTRQAIIKKVLPLFQQIAEGEKNYHPAVRVNAVTLIGLMYLDEDPKWPIPSPDAYAVLKRIFTDNKTPDYLKAAAASSIYGFAECSRRQGGNAVYGQDLKTELVAIVNGTTAGQDQWSDELDYWLKRRATQILGMVGDGRDVANLATKVMKAEQLDVKRDDFWLRYDGLNALKNLKFNTITADQVPGLIDDVLEYAAYVMAHESNWIQAKVEDLVYVNILWNDIDLEADGKRKKRNRPSGRGNPGRKGDPGPLGDGDVNSGGGGAGGGRGGGGFDGGGRLPDEDMEESEHVELPVFMLNDSRARVKSVLLTTRDFFQREVSINGERQTQGIGQVADPKQKSRIDDEVLPVIKQLLSDTELGVIDYRVLKGQKPDTKDVTYRLQGIYADSAKKLQALMTDPPKKMAADDMTKQADQ